MSFGYMNVMCVPQCYVNLFVDIHQISLEASMQGHMDDLERLKCGGFLSEFGIGSVSNLLFEILDITDKLLQSWTGWDYKPYYGITVSDTTSKLSCLPVGFLQGQISFCFQC